MAAEHTKYRMSPRVFISYSRESPEHERRVLELADRLRSDGINPGLHQPMDDQPNWMRRIEEEIRDADFVLIVCTKDYPCQLKRKELQHRASGVCWEASEIEKRLYLSDQSHHFLPIITSPADRRYIPGPLKSTQHYDLASPMGYDRLFGRLVGVRTEYRDENTAAFPSGEPCLGYKRIMDELAESVVHAEDKELLAEMGDDAFEVADQTRYVLLRTIDHPYIYKNTHSLANGPAPSTANTHDDDELSKGEWELVFKRLLARVHFMAVRFPEVFEGVSLEDTVNEAFVRFFSDTEQLGWNPAQRSLETFLWGVIRRSVLDRLAPIQKEGVRAAAEQGEGLVTRPRHDSRNPRLDRTPGTFDLELERILSAAAAVEGHKIDQELAFILDTSREKVVNLRKRLRRMIRTASSEHGKT